MAPPRPVILLTGAAGQLGRELDRALASCGEVVARTRAELDLADADALVAQVRVVRPDLIVNAAAYTAVDAAESEPETAQTINARAPGVLAEEAKRLGAILVHFSTDYVFDGAARVPYTETMSTRPLNVYGATKLEGEQAIDATGGAALVLRTSWVYGLVGVNFLTTIRRLAAERDEIRIVADQIGVPNWTRTLADAVARAVGHGLPALAERSGLYHLSCHGEASWYEFARAIVGDAARPRVVPIPTSEFPRPARRPAYGVLDGAKFERTFGVSLPSWRDAFAQCMQGLPKCTT